MNIYELGESLNILDKLHMSLASYLTNKDFEIGIKNALESIEKIERQVKFALISNEAQPIGIIDYDYGSNSTVYGVGDYYFEMDGVSEINKSLPSLGSGEALNISILNKPLTTNSLSFDACLDNIDEYVKIHGKEDAIQDHIKNVKESINTIKNNLYLYEGTKTNCELPDLTDNLVDNLNGMLSRTGYDVKVTVTNATLDKFIIFNFDKLSPDERVANSIDESLIFKIDKNNQLEINHKAKVRESDARSPFYIKEINEKYYIDQLFVTNPKYAKLAIDILGEVKDTQKAKEIKNDIINNSKASQGIVNSIKNLIQKTSKSAEQIDKAINKRLETRTQSFQYKMQKTMQPCI